MKVDILKLLLQSHAEANKSSLRNAALQLAAAEIVSGHSRLERHFTALDACRSFLARA